MKPEVKLYPHRLAAMEQFRDAPVGKSIPFLSRLGLPVTGKTNMLQQQIHAMSPEDRERFLQSVVVICPSFDIEGIGNHARDIEEYLNKKTTVLISSDTHIAARTGGGQSYAWDPRTALTRREKPNTTDMFRMFCDRKQNQRGR